MPKRAHVLLAAAGSAATALDVLRRSGFETQAFESLRHLGRAMDEAEPDLLVVDGPFAASASSGSPSGTEALARLRRAGSRAPAVVVCGSQTEARAVGARPELRPYLAVTALDAPTLDRVLGPLLRREASWAAQEREGSLSETRMQDLLLHVLSAGWTGRLLLASNDTEKTVYFDRGLPIYCSSNILSENFGQMLLRKEVISEIEYEWARKLQLREGIRQGEALVKIGVISHRDLFGLLGDQIEEKLINAFGWHEGTYELIDDDTFLDKVTRFSLNTVGIVVAGLKRFMTSGKALEIWRGLRHRWAVGACDVAEIASSVREALPPTVVEALREPQLVADVAVSEGWSRLAGAAVFSTLTRAGFIRLADDPEALPQSYGIDLQVPEITNRTGVFRALAEAREHRPAGVVVGEGEGPLSESLWKAYLRLSCADYLAVLGVTVQSEPNEIIAARDELLDVYSDVRFRVVLDRPQNIRALEELQNKIQLAAEVLLDPTRRSDYLATLPDPSEEPRRQVLGAEDEFQAGQSHLEAERWVEAYQAFARAMTLHPGEPSYMLYSGWARYLSARGDADRDEGRRLMTRAVAANPLLDEGYVLLARIFLREGNSAEAKAQAQTALTFNPDNDDAAELLESLED